MRDHLSVVVPCYNEDEVLAVTLSRLRQVCASADLAAWEIILVDDGSIDGTWSLIEQAIEGDSRIVGVRLSRNHGHQLALLAGLARVRGSVVLIIDADLQDPPEALQGMLARMHSERADVVYGQRTSREGESLFKRASAKAFYRLLSSMTRVDVPLDTGDFRLMSRRVSDHLLQMPERDRFTRGMVAWLGYKQVPFEYARHPRFAGTTKYTPRKMFSLAAQAFLGFSLAPLRLAILLSGLTFAFSVSVIAYVLWSWAAGQAVSGWASVMIFVSVVASAQFAVLGVMGEYIGRIYLEGKQRPLYLVSDLADHRPEHSSALRHSSENMESARVKVEHEGDEYGDQLAHHYRHAVDQQGNDKHGYAKP